MARMDTTVIALAAAAGLCVVVLGGGLSALLAERSAAWVVWPLLIVALSGFLVAGLIAGHLRSDTPMLHGAAAGAVAYTAALFVGLVAAAVQDRPISVVVVPLTALIAVTLGVAGSLVADAARRRSTAPRPSPGASTGSVGDAG